MALQYVSPSQKAAYEQSLRLFSKGASFLTCVSSHLFAERNGVCDLTGAKEQEEIFVLANRAGQTLKVGSRAMQIVANVLDIKDSETWYEHLKAQKKLQKEKHLSEQKKKEETQGQRTVVLRKKKPEWKDLISNS